MSRATGRASVRSVAGARPPIVQLPCIATDEGLVGVKEEDEGQGIATGVDRGEVRHGVELLGVAMDTHMENVIAAMQEIADELGLRKAPAPER